MQYSVLYKDSVDGEPQFQGEVTANNLEEAIEEAKQIVNIPDNYVVSQQSIYTDKEWGFDLLGKDDIKRIFVTFNESGINKEYCIEESV